MGRRSVSARAVQRPALVVLLSALVAVLIVTATVAVMVGPVAIAPALVWRVILHHVMPGVIAPDWQPFEEAIVWQLRLPRVLLGGIAGAGLAIVGATLQALVRNPLADPYLLGVSSGAGLGAVTVLLLGVTTFGLYSVSVAAFLGALFAVLCVYLLASEAGRFATGRLILAGVAVSYVLSALTNLIVYRSPDGQQGKRALFWLLGSLGGARWDAIWLPAGVLIAGAVLLTMNGRTLNILSVGEEGAATLGVDTSRARRQGFVLTSLITGVLVAVCGGIGFVGLIVPHVTRMAIGADHRRLLPVAALAGAIFLIWVDVFARVVIAPEELPVGIITALTGAPFFIWLMHRSSRARTFGR